MLKPNTPTLTALLLCLTILMALTACSLSGGPMEEPTTGAAPETAAPETAQAPGEPATGTPRTEMPPEETPELQAPTAEIKTDGTTGPETETPAPETQDDQTLTPFTGHSPDEIFQSLSQAERDCIQENFTTDQREQMLTLLASDPPNQENTAMMMQCAQEKTLLRVFVTITVRGPDPVTPQTSSCIRDGFSKTDLGNRIRTMAEGPNPQGKEWDDAKDTIADSMIMLYCLDETDWERAGPDGALEQERRMINCVVDTVGGPENIREHMEAKPGELSPMSDLMTVCSAPAPEEG